jgi:MFS family permease
MTYIRRALKYFIQTCLLLAIIIGILMLSGMVSKDISVAFTHGWKSVWWILAIFAVMALVYPFFGYQKRKIRVIGDPALARDGIVEALRGRGYVLEDEPDGALRFHLSSPLNRAARMWEDRITLTPVLGGFQAEGLSRDLVRVVSSIEQHFRNHGND